MDLFRGKVAWRCDDDDGRFLVLESWLAGLNIGRLTWKLNGIDYFSIVF